MRPGCPAPAQASLTFRYGSREAWIERLSAEPTPEAYDLCGSHAARTQPPHGWQLRDRRPREEQVEPPAEPEPRRDLGGQDTVAVLAAALRAVPDAAEDDVGAQTTTPAAEPRPDPRDAPEPGPPTADGSLLEDDTSPVLEQPPVAGASPAADPDPADSVDPAGPTEAATGTPRPVPAARARGIEPPAHPSARVPHGTARDW